MTKKTMTQVVILVILGAIFIALGGLCEKIAWEYYQNIKYQQSYSYRYFKFKTSSPEVLSDDSKFFLNKLDLAKRAADKSLKNIEKNSKIKLNMNRLRKINDYVFRIYRDFWFIQKSWEKTNGRYFQGKKTMPNPPDYKSDTKVELGFGLTDQIDDWRDIGYDVEYAPVQLECHVYKGPAGQGFAIWARVHHSGVTWQNQMHIGPETARDHENFTWVSVQNK